MILLSQQILKMQRKTFILLFNKSIVSASNSTTHWIHMKKSPFLWQNIAWSILHIGSTKDTTTSHENWIPFQRRICFHRNLILLDSKLGLLFTINGPLRCPSIFIIISNQNLLLFLYRSISTFSSNLLQT